MHRSNYGKLTVYASNGFPSRKRLESVKLAAEETAKRLYLGFQMVKSSKSTSPIYVYYEGNGDEPIPLYCDEGKMAGLEEISSSLRSMMFVLSFHPRQTALRQIRSQIVKLS
jgi:hypothetical protein